MRKENIKILSASLCYCKVLEIPPVSTREINNIIKYKLTSYYPGSVDDLKIDYIQKGNKVIVFYIPEDKYESFKKDNHNSSFYSSYHLFENINEKEGLYCTVLDDRLEILNFRENKFIDISSVPYSEETLSAQKAHGANLIAIDIKSLKKSDALFVKKKKSNFLLHIMILLTMTIAIPQLFYNYQIHMEENYLKEMELKLNTMVLQNKVESSAEIEQNQLKLEYEELISKKPLQLYPFFSDISSALGEESHIISLVLKGNSFQLNGIGLKPLEKMEKFQDNSNFQSVIPYQVQSIADSKKEKFSLTGFYANE